MIGSPTRSPALPPIPSGMTGYAEARADLVRRLLLERPDGSARRPLERLPIGDDTDWLVALCDAWGALTEVISFYHERIVNEAFLATAMEDASIERIYHSLGHRFPPNAAATTIVAYHLTGAAAGVEAVTRARNAGAGAGADERERLLRAAGSSPAAGSAEVPSTTAAVAVGPAGAQLTPTAFPPAGVAARPLPSQAAGAVGHQTQIPSLAAIRAVPGPAGRPPTFATLEPLVAYVGASRLKAAVRTAAAAAALEPATTQIELAGLQTGLAVGQPVLIVAQDPGAAPSTPGTAGPTWIRVLTGVRPDPKRGATRVGWAQPLGAAAASAIAPVVYGFKTSSALAGATTPSWASLGAAARLAVPAVDGQPLPRRGGMARSANHGRTWQLAPEGLPAGAALTAVCAYEDGTVVAAAGSAGLFRAVRDGPFAAAAVVGAKRFVYFLGGSAARMLAGGAGGAVYQSIDDGRTWSIVTSGPPTVTDKVVSTNQIPAVPVRSVLDMTGHDGALALLAGTDAGLYVYKETAQGATWKPGTLGAAVFAVWRPAATTRVPATAVVAATATGVFSPVVDPDSDVAPDWTTVQWRPLTGGPAGRVYAFAELGGTLYAGTDDGVIALPDGSPMTGIPAGTAVTALEVVDGTVLVAGTARGIYRWPSSRQQWVRCDRSRAFRLPPAALPGGHTGPVPPGLRSAFADFGIALHGDAALAEPAHGDSVGLSSGPDHYELVPIATGTSDAHWQVWVRGSLPGVTGLAVLPPPPASAATASEVVAVGGQVDTLATEWPGFMVAGNAVELAPPVTRLAPGEPAVIEQRTGNEPAATMLDLSAVMQDSVLRFGRQTAVTRLEFPQTLAPDSYPRRVSSVWTGATPLPLFAPPEAVVSTIERDTIPLAGELSAPLEPGRLASVTGSPIGLGVAPLGGAMRILGSDVMLVGPVQASVNAVTIDALGNVTLATSEGVFAVAPHTEPAQPTEGKFVKPHVGRPVRLADGWPRAHRRPAPATALVLVGKTLVAGSPDGVQALGTGAHDGWRASALQGEHVVALAASGARLVACTEDGAVHICSGELSDAAAWQQQGSPGAKATAVAAGPDATYVATDFGVSRLEPGGGWTPLMAGFEGSSVDDLLLDTHGTLWAASSQGVQTLAPGADAWRRDPARAQPVYALCLDPTESVVAAGADGIFSHGPAGWKPAGPVPDSLPGVIASAPDGSLWLGAKAAISLGVAAGHPALELSHELVFAEVAVTLADVTTLDQRALPQTVVDAFAENDRPLDTATLFVSGMQADGYWLARDGSELYVLALRTDAVGPATVSAYRNRTVAYPIGRSRTVGADSVWHVEVGGVPATLRAATASIHRLPARHDAPALAETATVARVEPTAKGPAIAGAGTSLKLEHALEQVYDPSTVQVNLNVVAAAQGSPVVVPIGSGDPRVANQSFRVPSPVAAIPATIAASTAAAAAAAGVAPAPAPAPTLRVFVDRQPWRAVPTLKGAGPGDRVYLLRHNLDGTVVVLFGDGQEGSRLPAGRDNVVASYLQGGGIAGEAASGALIQPIDRPQLVSAVHNPSAAVVPATPAAGASRSAAVRALDRIVTLGDYADVALSQPGVASATAEIVGGPTGRAVVITVARTPKAARGLPAQIAGAVGTTAASGAAVRVVEAGLVRVDASVEVVSEDDTVGDRVQQALEGLAARQPGQPLLAAQALSAAAVVTGVVAARIVSWHRDGAAPTTATALPAAGATWPAGAAAPLAAELLFIDGRSLTTTVVSPGTAMPT